MTNKYKVSLVPKLRFPEFKSGPGWEKRRVGDLLKETQRPIELVDVAEYCLVTVKRRYGGLVSRGNLKGKEIKVSSQFLVNAGDFLISKRQIVHDACGVVPPELDGSVVSNEYSVLTAKPGCNIDFFNWFAQQPSVSASFLECSVGIVIEKMLFKLNLWLKREFLFPLPLEQQKIADCLSSLDKLISAQAHKVGALKTHKKGLMQQLFPREGETQPRLRFPEFRDAGEWKELRLGQMGELVSGLTYSPGDVRDHGLLVLRSSNVQDGKISLADCVYVDPSIKGANLSVANDILICVRNGSATLIGKSALIPAGMPLCTHGAFMTVFRSTSPKFVFQLLQTDKYQKQVAGDLGATINSINGSQLVKYKFMVPKPEEQDKISVLLSSIDELIAAQATELERLKLHKSGLMQQLFVTAEGVDI